jgi:hypothetical protein
LPAVWLRFQISDQAIFEIVAYRYIENIAPEEFRNMGKDVGMVWKLFMKAA